MANHIPEEVIEEIQNKSDIVEVIGSYIPLKRAGGNFKAVCPFHNEKTPSFVVSPAKQIYHCFGCGAGGNVFGFVTNYEKLDFVEAVKMLAEKAGVVIPEKERFKGEGAVSKGVWDVNKFACDFFHDRLFSPAGKNALQYLKARNLKDEIVKKFFLGYAPAGNELIKEANKKGFSADLLVKAGLAVKTEKGLADMFRNRLMFPIFNVTGKAAGFSGRVLDNGLPKYLNTPETSIFHKGKILYGLHAAKPDIAKEDRAVICEGYFDFLRVYQEGLHNVVASQGTAFTIDHVNLLRRYASGIIISFDGDSAGDTASLRGIQMFLEEGIQVRVVEIPKGYDPDTFVNDKGIASFRKLAAEAKDILDIKLSRLCSQFSVKTTEGKLKVISGILPDIVIIRNEIRKRQFVKYVASKTGVPEESIWLELNKFSRSKSVSRKAGAVTGFTTENVISNLLDLPAERHLVQLAMDCEELSGALLDGSIVNQMKHPDYKKMLDLIINLRKTNRWSGPKSLLAHIENNDLSCLVTKLAAEEFSQTLDKQKNISDCIYAIRKRYREDRLKDLVSKISEAEKRKQDVSNLILEVTSLQKEIINK